MEDTQKELVKRIDKLLENLDVNQCRRLLEELIDEYTLGVFGICVMKELHDVKMESKGRTNVIQTMANGRAVLMSSFGFNIKSESKYPDGRTFLVLEEQTEKDFNQRNDFCG